LVLQEAPVREAVQADVVHLDARDGDQGTVGADQGAEGDGGAAGLVALAFEAPANVFHLQVHLQVVQGRFDEDGTPLAPLGQGRLRDQCRSNYPRAWPLTSLRDMEAGSQEREARMVRV
jgi:hypothetical protein